jgi:hypothetical protein
MPVSRICMVLALLALVTAAHAAERAGWYVVVGSFPEDATARMAGDMQRISATMAKCGLTTFNGFSGKFRGFRTGYNVFVVGPYVLQNDANAALTVAKRCVPDAYIKYGEYLGE